MKSYRKELWFETPTRRAFVNFTPAGRGRADRERRARGPGRQRHAHHRLRLHQRRRERVHADFEPGWSGSRRTSRSGLPPLPTGEDNADAHMKRQVMGREVVVAVTAGKLDFGPWEQIFYGDSTAAAARRAGQDHRRVAARGRAQRTRLQRRRASSAGSAVRPL